MNDNKNPPESAEILLYQTEDGQTRLEVRLQEETVWLTQKRMAELFQKNVRTINEHIQNIFEEGELAPESVIRKFRITADDGKSYDMQHYNLDVIISVGYRVKSHRGTQFRIWAKLDEFLKLSGRELLTHVGKISHEQALAKARLEYEKHRTMQINLPSPVEKDFERAMKRLPKPASKKMGK